MSKFTERLGEALAQKGATQQALADFVGVERTMITHWKSGYSSPNPEQIAKIAKFLNISADYLLGLEGEGWIYQLPKELLDFIREQALSGETVHLELAEEIKKSGIMPETVRAFVIALLNEAKHKVE